MNFHGDLNEKHHFHGDTCPYTGLWWSGGENEFVGEEDWQKFSDDEHRRLLLAEYSLLVNEILFPNRSIKNLIIEQSMNG